MLGIPYAPAGFDEKDRYFVTCPKCSERFYGCDESQETTEDAITKGSGMQYAAHYEAAHA